MPPGSQRCDTGQAGEPEFRRDLYQGAAGYCDPFRAPYPPSLIGDLAERVGELARCPP